MSAVYEIYASTQYSKGINKEAVLVTGSGYFTLDEDYDNQKAVVIYLNGLLVEEGVDYTREGIIIKKYSGDFTQDDVMVYDVIEGGTQSFDDFGGASPSQVQGGAAGKDLYIDGVKFVYNQDYTDNSNDLEYLQTIPSGRRGIVSRHGNVNSQIDGTIDKYDCFGNVYLISEQLWVDGLRKARVKEYSLNNPCHSANSNLVVAKKTTIIYDNNESYFNI